MNKFLPNFPYLSTTGDFIVKAGPPTDPSSEKVKVKVKLCVDRNGCFSVSSASMIETLPPVAEPTAAEEPMETSEAPIKDGEAGGENKENHQDAEPAAKADEDAAAKENIDEEKQNGDAAGTEKVFHLHLI